MAELDLTTREGRRKQGELIRRAAEEAGLSLEQLAREIGCSRALIYQYVSGATLAQPDKLTLIARRTGKPLAYFYGAVEPEPEAIRREREALKKEIQKVSELRQQLMRERLELEERRRKELLESLKDLADALSSPPDYKSLASTCERLISLAKELGDKKTEAEAYWRLGQALLRLADFEGAKSAFSKAANFFSELGEERRELLARQGLGHVLLTLGDPEGARAEFERVAKGHDWWNKWQGLVAIGAVEEWLGRYREASGALDKAQDVVEREGEPASKPLALLYIEANRVNLFIGCGDFREALERAEKCAREADRLGARDQYIEALLNVGVCKHRLGDWAGARAALRHAVELADFSGDQERAAVGRACLSRLLSECGDFEGAKQLGKDALTEALRTGARRAELWAQTALAEAYLRSDSPKEAMYHAERALEIARALRHSHEVAFCEALRASVLVELGRPGEAERAGKEALSEAERMGARLVSCMAKVALAFSSLSKGEEEKALEWAEEAEKEAKEIDAPDLLWRSLWAKAKALMARGEKEDALSALDEVASILSRLRENLLKAGLDDTVLEERDRTEALMDRLRLLAELRGREVADKALREANWPPLEEAWNREAGR